MGKSGRQGTAGAGLEDELESLYLRAAALLADPDDEALSEASDDDGEAGERRDEPFEAPDDQNLEEALGLCASGTRKALAAGELQLASDFLLLAGVAHGRLGDFAKALESLDRALEHDAESFDAALERAIALFELCRFEEAQKGFVQLSQREPEEPWCHHYLGLLAERRRDDAEAKRRFGQARKLDPEAFPKPVALSDRDFDAALAAAMGALSAEVKRHLENTTIAVEPFPSDAELTAEQPPLSPTLLGLFKGTPIGERSVTNAFDHFPSAIVLYQRNLERFARTKAELIEQIAITLRHEVGHLVGLDEDDLAERGLE